ncbi:MAG TPA: hypothetical protein VNI78_01240 [Vicinamibacterales bacterium]|nr:hypothetical protein [Vicinamibacterales bacterium]
MVARAAAGLLALLIPAMVGAQEAVRGWQGLRVDALPLVYVRDTAGVETTGRLVRLDPDAVVLLVDGAERRLETVRVSRIDRRGDSLRNGALIGGGVGVGMGLLAGGLADCAADGSGDCPGMRVAMVVVSTAVHAAIGTAVDAAVPGRTTIYVAATSSPAQPVARPGAGSSGRSAAFGLSLTW